MSRLGSFVDGRASAFWTAWIIWSIGLLPASASSEQTSGTWSKLITPPRRTGATAILDAPGDRMILFGGSCIRMSDLWALPLGAGGSWELMDLPGSPLPSRWAHTAIYDPVRRRMIVFGGADGQIPTADLWELTLTGTPIWRPMFASGTAPAPRYGHTAIYDPDGDRMIVFAGATSPTSEPSPQYANDVWALALSTSTWSRVDATGAAPSPRAYCSAVNDPLRRRMIVFGGSDNGYASSDLYELSLGDGPVWSTISTTGTPALGIHHLAAYDSVADRMIVWQPPSEVTGLSLHFLEFSGSPHWTEKAINDLAYDGSGQAGIFDPARNRLVTVGGSWYGGTSIGSCVDQTYEVNLDAAPSQRHMFETPPNRMGSTLVLDTVGDRGIRFGGRFGTPYETETWQLSLERGGLWRPLVAGGTEPRRAYHASVFDPVRNQMLVIGGATESSPQNDTWALSLGAFPEWSEVLVSGVPPPPMGYHAAVFDPLGDRVIVLGASGGPGYRNELWSLGLNGEATWTALDPAGEPPPPRAGHVLIYDSIRDRILVLGGSDTVADNRFLVQALELRPVLRWSMVPASGNPPPERYFHGAIFDPARNRIVIYCESEQYYDRNDVWVLNLEGDPAWAQLEPSGTHPPPTDFVEAIYDARRDRMIVHDSDTSPLNLPTTTWELRWGEVARPVVGCPGVESWIDPGARVPLQYSVTNPLKEPRTVEWSLSSERNWPGLPMLGTLQLPGQETSHIGVEVLVPDTATFGVNRLRFSVRYQGSPESASFCEHFLGDAATPALASALAPEIIEGVIVVRWFVHSGGQALRVKSRKGTSDWQPAGIATPDGRDILRFEDASAAAGQTCAYLLGVPTGEGETWTGLIEVTLPTLELTLAVSSLDPTATAIQVAFTLPMSAPALLEVFDASGRRVMSRRITNAAGRHTMALDVESRPAGIYFARITQASRSARTRFALVR